MLLDRFAKWYYKAKKRIILVYILYLSSAMLVYVAISYLFGEKTAFSIVILYAYVWFYLIVYAEKKAEVMDL